MLSKRPLTLLISISMIIQIWTASGVALAAPTGQEVHIAAVGGPVLESTYPADNDAVVPANAIFQIRFDESVQKASVSGSSASVSIYEQLTNTLVESIVVATSSTSKISISGKEAKIYPASSSLVSGKAYYVLVDQGAFVSSNGVFAGVTNATAWNFTAIGSDSVKPAVTSSSPVNSGTIGATNALILTFSEIVTAASGNIRIIRRDNGEEKVISVLSSSVTGNGTTQIQIQPSLRLDADEDYYVLIDQGAFVDRAGNVFDGYTTATQWVFHTSPSTISAPELSPVNGRSGVAYDDPVLTMTFASAMHAGTGSLRIKKVATNETIQTVPVTASLISTSGLVVSMPLNDLAVNTAYYIQVDSGALLNASNEPYLGITDAISWTFTTIAAVDSAKPVVSVLTPVDNGKLGSTTGTLTIKFNERVYPVSGSITIRNSNGSLFCSIPVTASGVVGGGTDTITITPCASFLQGSSYSVQISPTAFRDASDNYYAGIATSDYTSWNFTISTDTSAPELIVTDPVNDATGVRRNNLVLTGTFSEAVQVTSGATATLNTAAGSVVTPIALTLTRHSSDAKKVSFTLPGGVTLNVNTLYYVNIPTGSITDVAGNAFQGILNPYRWSFKTVVSDTTAPVLSTVSIDGSAIVLTYDQELDGTAIPSAAQYYVSVNTLPRSVTSVAVTGKQVKLTLSSGVLVGQAVKVSFSSGTLKNLGSPAILAASFASREVTNATDTTLPRPSSGTIASTILTLTFSKPLAAITGTNATSQFKARLNGTLYTPTVAYTSGSNLILILPNAYQGTGSVTASYTPGVGGDHLRDTTGYTVSAFSEFFIANGNDTVAPILSTGLATGNKIMLVYNEGLRTTTVPPTTSFSVLVNGITATVLSVAINNNTVELTMSQAIATGQSVLVTYLPGTPALADLAGNPAQVLAGHQIISGTTSTATLSSATVSGNLLTLNYSAALSSAVVPSNAQYVIRVNGSYMGANTVSVSGTQVILTLTSQIQAGQTVKVSYYATGSLLKDLANQTVAAFSDYTVTTSSSGIVNLPNYLVSDGESGIQFNSTAISTQPGTTSNGRSINRYVVNSDYLSSAFTWVKSSGSQLKSPTISIRVPSTEAGAVVQIPIYALVDASSRVSNGSIRVDYGDLRFELPLSAVKYTQEVTALGGSLTSSTLEVSMERTTDSVLTSAIGSSSAVILGLPVDFSVKIVSAGRQSEVKQYDQYVTRTFVVPASSASQLSQLTVVRMDDSTGVLSYVPTVAESGTGGIHVSFKRKGNSTYALVRKAPATYSDMANHWANDYVSLLAAKWIVSGTSFTAYSPSKAITRSDFAKYIANGLGLTGNASSAARFRDVGTNGKDAAYIGAVSDAGIISGKTDGNFDPNAAITREEMASMMLRAMNYAGVQPSSASLTKFTDRTKIGSWATNAVAACVDAGIIAGVTTTTFQPKANATRAQAAVMIVRMLQYSELLQA
ncbi:Ig-like domain-containing protein [Cohnella sp.]|uniref:Ig-like domain-containing protein n=1 Tax=Cohnella sp. TaxID=1883426 RepID=UPI003563E039